MATLKSNNKKQAKPEISFQLDIALENFNTQDLKTENLKEVIEQLQQKAKENPWDQKVVFALADLAIQMENNLGKEGAKEYFKKGARLAESIGLPAIFHYLQRRGNINSQNKKTKPKKDYYLRLYRTWFLFAHIVLEGIKTYQESDKLNDLSTKAAIDYAKASLKLSIANYDKLAEFIYNKDSTNSKKKETERKNKGLVNLAKQVTMIPPRADHANVCEEWLNSLMASPNLMVVNLWKSLYLSLLYIASRDSKDYLKANSDYPVIQQMLDGLSVIKKRMASLSEKDKNDLIGKIEKLTNNSTSFLQLIKDLPSILQDPQQVKLWFFKHLAKELRENTSFYIQKAIPKDEITETILEPYKENLNLSKQEQDELDKECGLERSSRKANIWFYRRYLNDPKVMVRESAEIVLQAKAALLRLVKQEQYEELEKYQEELRVEFGLKDKPLLEAILLEDEERIEQLWNADNLRNQRDQANMSALHMAILNQQGELSIQIAQECPELIRQRDDKGYAPVHYMVLSDDLKFIETVLDKVPAMAKLVTTRGQSLLHLFAKAIKKGEHPHIEVLNALLKTGLRADQKDNLFNQPHDYLKSDELEAWAKNDEENYRYLKIFNILDEDTLTKTEKESRQSKIKELAEIITKLPRLFEQFEKSLSHSSNQELNNEDSGFLRKLGRAYVDQAHLAFLDNPSKFKIDSVEISQNTIFERLQKILHEDMKNKLHKDMPQIKALITQLKAIELKDNKEEAFKLKVEQYLHKLQAEYEGLKKRADFYNELYKFLDNLSQFLQMSEQGQQLVRDRLATVLKEGNSLDVMSEEASIPTDSTGNSVKELAAKFEQLRKDVKNIQQSLEQTVQLKAKGSIESSAAKPASQQTISGSQQLKFQRSSSQGKERTQSPKQTVSSPKGIRAEQGNTAKRKNFAHLSVLTQGSTDKPVSQQTISRSPLVQFQGSSSQGKRGLQSPKQTVSSPRGVREEQRNMGKAKGAMQGSAGRYASQGKGGVQSPKQTVSSPKYLESRRGPSLFSTRSSKPNQTTENVERSSIQTGASEGKVIEIAKGTVAQMRARFGG